MTVAPVRKLVPMAAWLIAAMLLFWPLAALLTRTVMEATAPAGGFTYSTRQLGLLWRSVWLSLAAAVACVLLAVPAVYALGHLPNPARPRALRLTLAALAAALLCPPMVCVFAWQRLLPSGTNAYAECAAVWAMWAWPVPALILSAAWRTSGRSSYEAARLEATPTRAFLHVALPILRGPIALCLLILFVIFVAEYTVPHACGLLVYATELLGWSAGSPATLDTVWPALPLVAVAVAGVIGAAVQWRSGTRTTEHRIGPEASPSTGWPLVLIASIVTVTWLLPIGALAASISSLAAAGDAIRIYGRDMLASFGVAALSALVVIALGLIVLTRPRLRTPALIAALALGAFPGALVGEAVMAAYNYELFKALYDHWPIMVLGYAARFAWIGCVIALSLEHRLGRLSDQARTDGAGPLRELVHVNLPMWSPTLLFAAAAVTALALGDVATTTLIRVPDFNPVAHVIIEKFHRREDDTLVSLSVALVVAAFPAVLLAAAAVLPGTDHQHRGQRVNG